MAPLQRRFITIMLHCKNGPPAMPFLGRGSMAPCLPPRVTAYRKGSCFYPLRAGHFNRCLRRCLSSAGINASKLSTHSFRRGGATLASEAGMADNSLQTQGNWRSSCFERYIARDKQNRNAFASHFAVQLSSSRHP